ncbi:hypothetical protein [Inquilinus limosus]|uniref:hypothetical protein n=1 Tax=Inquilinus limosus TaxID=171674 RepID=UPI0011982324|nr:hypothetical protein [Inquilinus limosus]
MVFLASCMVASRSRRSGAGRLFPPAQRGLPQDQPTARPDVAAARLAEKAAADDTLPAEAAEPASVEGWPRPMDESATGRLPSKPWKPDSS